MNVFSVGYSDKVGWSECVSETVATFACYLSFSSCLDY
jgi:hypothetical protein